ncbi:MAG: PocR ligand-binding domain-containing protein [Deltaproteobacteria bacterium]|nr:PocR ligand-binding domain-containing protein [Deltaproteobacteria bacterium]
MSAEPHAPKQMRLAELVDLEAFREVMQSFADLYRIGVKVFDADGAKLVDVRVGAGPFCAYLFQHAATKTACTRLVGQLKSDPLDEQGGVKLVQCFSGLRYAVLPLVYEGDALGRVIFGPFWPKDEVAPSPRLREMEPGLDFAQLAELARAVRDASDEGVRKMLGQLRLFVEVLLFSSYRAALTSQMHIESVTSSYHELSEKNRQLLEANERLKELDRVKSNFLAMVSHELRTPLTSIIGYAEMLHEGMAGELNAEQLEYVGTIMDKGENLLSMISSLLDISRIEAGKMRLVYSEISLSEVAAAATSSVLPQIAKKKLSFAQQIADDLPALTADRDKVRQIAINLLANAVKFTPDGGGVRLEIDRYFGARHSAAAAGGTGSVFERGEEDFIRIRISDTGIGIPADQQERVFDSFYQVDSSSTREYGGTGLGLAIVKSFVEGHRGEVWVESRVGEGSTFTVLLPTARG